MRKDHQGNFGSKKMLERFTNPLFGKLLNVAEFTFTNQLNPEGIKTLPESGNFQTRRFNLDDVTTVF
jgi:hypothetical protein